MLTTALLYVCLAVAPPVRIKELAALEGVRENQLLGYGLVVGLNGTGDKRQTFFSAQSLTNLLERMGVTVPPQAILVRNTAAVMVTATLPAYAQPGRRIDVTAAALGDAQNLLSIAESGLSSINDILATMTRIYGDLITPQHTVTVIYFSRVEE